MAEVEDSPTDEASPADQAPLRPAFHGPAEALGLLALAFALHLGVSALSGLGSVAADLAPALEVLVWVLPAYLLLQRRGEDPWLRHGLTTRPHSLVSASLVSAALLGTFVAAAALFAPSPSAGGVVAWGPMLATLPYQLVFVAFKEEYFFRGVLQPALEAPGGPRLRVLGAPLGRGALAAAALFALAHLYPDPNPARLLTFFPALWFAWLRAKTGSIVPAMIGHAGANLTGAACAQAFGVSF